MGRNRGKKKPSLRDLSRAVPTEEQWAPFFEDIKTQSDRGAALVAGSLADATLKLALQCRMIEMTPEMTDQVFDGDKAPLGSFYARIRLARALGIFGPRREAQIDTIRQIRNQFAHALIAIDFNEPLIVQKCEDFPLAMHTKWPLPNDWKDARIRYVTACFSAADFLVTQAFKYGGKEIEVEDWGTSIHLRSPLVSSLGKPA